MNARPTWAWVKIAALQAVQGLSLLPWLMIAGLAVMAFDAPGSTKMWQPWAFVLAIWSYPIWIVLGAIASWVLFRFGRPVSAIAIAVLLTLPIPGLMLMVAISSLWA